MSPTQKMNAKKGTTNRSWPKDNQTSGDKDIDLRKLNIQMCLLYIIFCSLIWRMSLLWGFSWPGIATISIIHQAMSFFSACRSKHISVSPSCIFKISVDASFLVFLFLHRCIIWWRNKSLDRTLKRVCTVFPDWFPLCKFLLHSPSTLYTFPYLFFLHS